MVRIAPTSDEFARISRMSNDERVSYIYIFIILILIIGFVTCHLAVNKPIFEQ